MISHKDVLVKGKKGNTSVVDIYLAVRRRSEMICRPLKVEDYVVQPIVDVSPPKWHLGHTTWFFETFILKIYSPGYKEYNSDYNFVFNSYYETIGARVIRTDRGNLSRPTVEDVYLYRKHVDTAMVNLLEAGLDTELAEMVLLGLNHEEQHQELLYTDIKFILGHNPLFPAYSHMMFEDMPCEALNEYVSIDEGIYAIGYSGEGFCFDNELAHHKVYLNAYQVSTAEVTNGDYLEFINASGYSDFRFWHSEGWDWVKQNNIQAPLYWHFIDGEWFYYTLSGLMKVDISKPVSHVSYYEASAFASWKGQRLPTEFEWEVAANRFRWGKRWEWTESAYLPYPGFKKAPGAIGEYNGKFMVNQMVLRGGSVVTPPGHTRSTYRNFFHPHLRWQFTGIRLAK